MRALALALAMATAASAAQASDPIARLEEWIVAVDSHAAGEEDDALAGLDKWSYADFNLMRRYAEALVEAPTKDNPGRKARLTLLQKGELAAISGLRDRYLLTARFDQFRRRAAILHTDAALLSRLPLVTNDPQQQPAGGTSTPENDHVDVMSADGVVDSFRLANPNWFYARDMLDAISISGRRPIVPQWYRTVAAYYAAHDNLADAYRHFEQAHRVVPDDPGVMYGEACFQETLGSPNIQNFARVTTLPGGYTLRGVFPSQRHFHNAETLLTRALAAQPEFLDAHLRLGRVLNAQRQFDAALPHLTKVIAGSSDPVLIYYAHLFSGDAMLGLERLPEARASYERAIALRPSSQAAHLGLATALRAAGDRTAAIEAVMATATLPPGERDGRDDPWWDYYKGDAANVERLLSELRAPFLKPGR